MNISLCYLMMPSPFSWYKFVLLQRHQLPLGLFETLIHLFQPYPAAHFISFPLLNYPPDTLSMGNCSGLQLAPFHKRIMSDPLYSLYVHWYRLENAPNGQSEVWLEN